MTKRYDVVGLGNAIVDVLAHVNDAFLENHGAPKGGMTLVDAEQSAALYADLGPTTEQSGGSVANSIAALAQLGSETAFLGRVRDDQLGEIFRHDIRAVGADFDSPPATEGPATARCMVMVTPDAERTMCTYLGAATDFAPEDVIPETIRAADHVYLEGYLWDKPDAKEAFRQAMRLTKEAGGKVAITFSDAFCVERHRDSFAEIIEGDVDILFANDAELKTFYQTDDFSAAIEQIRKHVDIAAVTRGERGAVVATRDHIQAVPAQPVERLVDTTGAGDLFAAGFLHGLARGATPEKAARMGCTAAAAIIQQIGARYQDDMKALFAARGF